MIPVLHGNAADDRVLAAANLVAARLLLVAIPNAFEAGQIAEQARAANPKLEIVARAHFDAEVEHLHRRGADAVIMGEREIARAMPWCAPTSMSLGAATRSRPICSVLSISCAARPADGKVAASGDATYAWNI